MITSLHTNTEYSLLSSTIKLTKLIDFAKENDLKALTITDHNNLHGVADFVYLCEKNDIKPIIGIDLDVEDYRLILIARDYTGYKQLIKLSSRKMSGEEIKVEEIQPKNLFVIDHPTYGHFAKTNRQLNIEGYFVGTNTPTMANHIFVNETKILYEEENEGISVLKSLASGDYQLESESYKPYGEGIEDNSPEAEKIQTIIDASNVIFPKHKDILPKFDPENDSEDLLKSLVVNGIRKKLGVRPGVEYLERVKEELSIIIQLGFADYFLIIQDLIDWSRKQQIEVGPGRGSAAGSLVSYLIGITEVDPIEYGLLFERFLNPERVSLPDIDIDIQDTRRDEVINYLYDKYGSKRVAMISTFQTIGAKNAIRDTGRVLGMPLRDVDMISKAIPTGMHLRQAAKASSKFRALITKNEEYERLFAKAQLIEGLPRNLGTHAAGIVISQVDLTEKAPIQLNSEGKRQLQFSMDHLEEHGLLKIDLLGLRNLSILKDIVSEVYLNYNKKIDFTKLKFDDKGVFKLLTEGNTNGIFQFESYGIKDALRTTKINSFGDMVAVLSLFRPGPMENIPEYAKRKNENLIWESVSSEYDAIVKDTYGIIIYQEQIMLIAQAFAGMTFAKADVFRRAIGKKNLTLLGSLKTEFVEGAKSRGHDTKAINAVYASIKKFANYGFNKSHAVAYGFLSYRLAFLKFRFPVEFYTSLLNASIGSLDSISKYVYEARSNRITIFGPHINKSKDVVYNEKKQIYLTFNVVKGIGTAAATKIIKERDANGAFKDFFDFVSRASINGIGDTTIESLIKAGAMIEWGKPNSLIASLPIAQRYAEMITVKVDGVNVLDHDMITKPKIVKAEENEDTAIKDQESLIGISFFESKAYKLELNDKLNSITIGTKKQIVAKIKVMKELIDKNGNEMGRVVLKDSTMELTATVFNNVWKFIKNEKVGSIVKVEVQAKEYNDRTTYNINSRWEVINV